MSYPTAQEVADSLAGWMPPERQYMALAQAMHDASDMCNGSYVIPFDRCGAREADIQDAITILRDLRADDWILVRNPVSVKGFGL